MVAGAAGFLWDGRKAQWLFRRDKAVTSAGLKDVGDVTPPWIVRAGFVQAGRGKMVSGKVACLVVVTDIQWDEGVFHPEGDGLGRVEEKEHPCSWGKPGTIHQATRAALVISGYFGTDQLFAVVQPQVGGMAVRGRKGGKEGKGERFHGRIFGRWVTRIHVISTKSGRWSLSA